MTNSSFDITTQQEEDKLLAFFQRRSAMSVYFQAVRNAYIALINSDKKPDWYDPLNADLAALQRQAQQWFDQQAPTMTQIPQAYINFTDSFLGQYDLLNTLFNQLINKSSGNTDQIVEQISTIIDALVGDAQTQQTAITSLDTSLQSFLGLVSGDITRLTTGADSVTQAITDDKGKVIEITNDITNLHSQLSADTTAAMTGSSALNFDVECGASCFWFIVLLRYATLLRSHT